uniref:KH domain-containing protein HEN4 n=1 Tax=Erigeron canadensis TaxID=72917 RepID=UPI001CB95579|nr:KH domain-containing protein HEN4 [Erigeron canadensis]
MAGQKNDFGKRSYYQSDQHSGGGGKRRNPEEDRDSHAIGPEDTVYRYLCPLGKIGSIIGRGGDIVKQMREDTRAKIRINEAVPGCDERVVMIYSSSDETNCFGDSDEYVSPAHDALFMVHDRIIAEDTPPIDDQYDEPHQVTVRLLVSADQIGCVIGKGGQVVQNIRNDTGVEIRILTSEHLPACALSSDEVLQVNGDAAAVRKGLFQVARRLHDNPSRSQHLLLSASNLHRPSASYVAAPSLIAAPYGDWSASAKEFSLRLVCPTENIGSVIGKSGVIIKQIRQETGAAIKVDSSATEGNDCLITVSAKEVFDEPSPTIDAALRLLPRCSEKLERDSGDSILTTRLLVPSSRTGFLIGKGGAAISEMRNLTRASIRILRDRDLPRVAARDEEMVQITGDVKVASSALLQVAMRLRAYAFEMEGAVVTLPPADPYGGYVGPQIAGSPYGAYGVYTGRIKQ